MRMEFLLLTYCSPVSNREAKQGIFIWPPLAVIMRQWESNQERFPLATLQFIFSHPSQWVLYGQRYNSDCLFYVCERRENLWVSLPSVFSQLSFFPPAHSSHSALGFSRCVFCVSVRAWVTSTFLKSSVQSLAFSPNCHLHCVSASYSSPGSCSGYRYSFTALGSSDKQSDWAELKDGKTNKDGNEGRKFRWVADGWRERQTIATSNNYHLESV